MDSRFIIVSAHTPEDLIAALNEMAVTEYFSIIKVYEEYDRQGVVKGAQWRAIVDRVTFVDTGVEIGT